MIRSRLLFAPIALVALVAMSSAHAQKTGSLVMPNRHAAPVSLLSDEANSDEGQNFIDRYSVCLIKDNRKAVEHFLALPPGDAALKAGNKLVTPNCFANGGSLRLSARLLRGSLYRALYRNDFPGSGPPIAETGPDYAADLKDAAADDKDMKLAEANSQYVLLRGFAECVVRADPASSREFTLSSFGSDREGIAFASLRPKLGPCLQSGAKVTISKQMLSGLVGEILYRLSTRQTIAGIQ